VPKPTSAHAHSARLACCGLATVPNRLEQRGPLPAWPAIGRSPRSHTACAWLTAGQARLTVACQRPNLGKVYTASFPSPRCTRLTRLRAPARSEEAGDGGAELTGAVDAAEAQRRWRCRLLRSGSSSEAQGSS
jgi:hypothetical protein